MPPGSCWNEECGEAIRKTIEKKPDAAGQIKALIDAVIAWESIAIAYTNETGKRIGDDDEAGIDWTEAGGSLRRLADTIISVPAAFVLHQYFNDVSDQYGD